MQSQVEIELERDYSLLRAVESGAQASFRTWNSDRPAVVVGRSVRIEEEVHLAWCRRHSVPVVRRSSGGRSVVIGPGTLQYTFVVPLAAADGLDSIARLKQLTNTLLVAGLGDAGVGSEVEADACGDLVVAGRKVGGLALRCRRRAALVHGSLLVDADIDQVACALAHPRREPSYRAGRSHREFLANLGTFAVARLEASVDASLARLGQLGLHALPTRHQLLELRRVAAIGAE